MTSVGRHHGLGGPRAADRHARNAASRWRHDGSEARWPRSDLRLRRILSMTFAPLFTASGTVFLMAGAALLDLSVIKRRHREQQRWHHDA